MKYFYALLIIVLLAVVATSCWVFPDMAIPFEDAPVEVVIDTCEQYNPVDTPYFSNLYSAYGVHPPSTTYVYAGGDSLIWTPGDTAFAESMEAFLKTVWPPFEFHCYGDGPENMAIIIIGSHDSKFFARNISFKTQFARGTFGDVPYGLFLMGQATFEEFDSISTKLQSVEWVNFKGDYDSLQLTKLARNVLGDCKRGGKWVDFRFNNFPVDSSLVDSFHLAQWEKVLE